MDMVDSDNSYKPAATSFFYRLVLVVLTILLSGVAVTVSAQVNGQKRVLVLHLMRRNDSSTLANERTYQRVLTNGLGGRLDYYSEYVDLARFGGTDYQGALRDFLEQKYKGTQFDVIIAPTADMRRFLIRNGPELFPNVPVVFS